jgi:hypothetical protein
LKWGRIMLEKDRKILGIRQEKDGTILGQESARYKEGKCLK